MKRTLLVCVVAVAALTVVARGATSFSVLEASIPEMQDAMAKGRLTSVELVTLYLTRIALYEHRLHAAIAINPLPLDEAVAPDRGPPARRSRGPVHGIPAAAKNNIT